MDQQSLSCTPTSVKAKTRQVPTWVPESVQRYLTHTEAGLPIREVARQSGCHASTVLRQIRRIETRRDDPLVDRALVALSSRFFHGRSDRKAKETDAMGTCVDNTGILEDAAQLDREALRVLRRLCETGAVLAVAEGMETAVVVRETAQGVTTKTASVTARYVEAMALNAWIECARPARISRYRITHAGRAKLDHLMERAGDGYADSASPFADQHRAYGEKTVHSDGRKQRLRYNMCESPVTALARRKDKDGAYFLSETLVSAAERFFARGFRIVPDGAARCAELGSLPDRRRPWWFSVRRGDRQRAERGAGARCGGLRYLGPGLGDVALRCCCYLEGLESAEKRMGWSARSGKIVLRIALQRLSHFYETEVGDVLIG